MRRIKWTAAALIVAALAPGLAGGAVNERRLERGAKEAPAFGEFREGAGLPGWRYAQGGDDHSGTGRWYSMPVDASARAAGPRGALSVVLTREADTAGIEALASFSRDDGSPLLVLEVHWPAEGGGRPGLNVVRSVRDLPQELWYRSTEGGGKSEYFPFPFDVPVGRTFRVTATWGEVGETGLYLDARPFSVDGAARADLSTVLGSATEVVVGAERNRRGSVYSRVRSTLSSVALADSPSLADLLGAQVVVAAERRVYAAGDEVVVTVTGGADRRATFSLGDLARDVAMVEVDDGVYVGKVTIPEGTEASSAALSATLADPESGSIASAHGVSVVIDGTPPAPPERVLAWASGGGEVEVGWLASAAADLDRYSVYRGEGAAPSLAGVAYAEVRGLSFVDARVIPGLSYQYVVVAVDEAGNRSAPGQPVSATAVAGEGPALREIEVAPRERPLRPGQVLSVSVSGLSGGKMSVDVGELAKGLAALEEGRTGRYVATYTVREGDVGPTKGLHRVVARLSDAFGENALAGPEVAIVGLDGLNDKTPPAVTKASHDGWQVAGLSGKLVAGDRVTITLEGEPAGYASFELSEVAGRVGMKETGPGIYEGAFTVTWGASGEAVPVTVFLADDGGNETAVVAERGLAFDTRVRLVVAAQDALLPADRKAQTRLTAKALNANGDKVERHDLVLTLSTTKEYTGVVGGGDIEGRRASKEDVDDVEVKWGGTTDAFGEVSAVYTAGFAAKTALIVAKDVTTGDVGAGWLNTYVASTVAIELAPRGAKGAEDRAILRIAADPQKLTADGRSTSRIKVWLTDLSGTPLAGARVAFALGNENGRLRVLQGTTNERGLAEAEYRAGTAIGTVTVTASVAEQGVSGSVQIVLLADAPARIDLVASAAKLVANGSDKATLSIRVSDIHDNPNDNVPVTFKVVQGAGRVSAPAIATNRYGEGEVVFTAGTTAGIAVVEARHTSREPTEEELRRVYGTVFVPRWFERQERDRMTLGEWRVEPGDEVEKGQVLVTVDTRTGARELVAPAKGVFVREVRHERDRVELGDTVGYVEIDPDVWKANYAK